MTRFFFSSRRRHTRLQGDWSSDVCSSDLELVPDEVLKDDRQISAPRFGIQFPYVDPPYTNTAIRWLVQTGQQFDEIGRASCRERVGISEGAVVSEEKRREEMLVTQAGGSV